MLNELMPNISRHFLFSILTQNQISGMRIIETIAESETEEVGEFLSSLVNSLVGYFFRLDACLEGYNQIRIQAVEDLKNLELKDDLEELD